MIQPKNCIFMSDVSDVSDENSHKCMWMEYILIKWNEVFHISVWMHAVELSNLLFNIVFFKIPLYEFLKNEI